MGDEKFVPGMGVGLNPPVVTVWAGATPARRSKATAAGQETKRFMTDLSSVSYWFVLLVQLRLGGQLAIGNGLLPGLVGALPLILRASGVKSNIHCGGELVQVPGREPAYAHLLVSQQA